MVVVSSRLLVTSMNWCSHLSLVIVSRYNPIYEHTYVSTITHIYIYVYLYLYIYTYIQSLNPICIRIRSSLLTIEAAALIAAPPPRRSETVKDPKPIQSKKSEFIQALKDVQGLGFRVQGLRFRG